MSKLTYGSVCSGIEAATAAWHQLGWQAQWFSEIENFPSAVLQHHYPDIPNYGDMTKYKEWPNDRSIDLLVGGTPCQSFSVAGLRKGLSDPRGNLMLTYLAIAARYSCRWVVWENVPGVLSSNGGRDFGTFLGALGKLGYGFAYRVLDAQYFGVAQRRRRVFVVGYLGDWRRAAAVLFERESMSGHSAPSRKEREEVAKCLTSRVGQANCGETEQFVVENKWPADIASTLNASFGDKQGLEDQHINSGAPLFVPAHEKVGTLTASYGMGGVDIETKPVVFGAQNSSKQGLSASTEVSPTLDTSKTPAVSYGIPGNWIGRKPENGGNSTTPMNNVSPNLTSADRHAVAFTQNTRDEVRYINGDGKIVGALAANSGAKQTNYLQQEMKVRRLTPKECERLQGFPDNFTQIPYRNKDAEECPDGPRYKAMGNSMAVPVMRWIGERIEKIEKIK
jgi:DNA (cytosine-5)-methyltransferase 1